MSFLNFKQFLLLTFLCAISLIGNIRCANDGFSGSSLTKNTFLFVGQASQSSFEVAKTSDSSGALVDVLKKTTTTGGIFAMAAHPILRTLYTLGGGGDASQYSISRDGTPVSIGADIADSTFPNPIFAAVTPDGKFLHVVDGTSNGGVGGIRVYAINQTTGALTQGSTYLGSDAGNSPTQPWSVAVTPDSRFAYFPYIGSSQICGASINSTTGALTQIGTTCLATSIAFYNVAVSPEGTVLYASGSGAGIHRYSIDSSTGALTLLGTTTLPGSSGSIYSWAMVRTGRYLIAAVNNATVSSFYINSDGTLGTPSTTSTVISFDRMVASPSGEFVFGADQSINQVYSLAVDSAGALTRSSTVFTANLNGPVSMTSIKR